MTTPRARRAPRGGAGSPPAAQPDQSNAVELAFDEHCRLVGDFLVDLRRAFRAGPR